MSNKIEVDTKTFVRFWLVILGLGLIALFIWQAATGLLILGISLFLAIAISPFVNRIAGIFPGEGRKLPTAIACIIVMATLSVVLLVVVPAVVRETTRFVGNLPGTVEDVTSGLDWVDDLGRRVGVEDLQAQLMSGVSEFSGQFVKDFGSNLLNSIGAIGSFLAAFILVLVLTFLMLIEGPGVMKEFWRRFGQSKRMKKVQKVTHRMADVVAKFAAGEVTIGLMNGAATMVVVVILALAFGFSAELALPFGLITGVLCMVPMFGASIGGVLVTLLLMISSFWAGLAFMVYYLVYMQIEANIITPKVQSRGMHLPALVVLSSITVGIYMFGLVGAIISIPIAGCIKVLLEEYAVGGDVAAAK